MPTFEHDLEKISLFSFLKGNQEAIKALSEKMIQKELPEGFTLIKEGDLGDEAYILIKGQVSIYRRTAEGDMYKVVILKDDIKPAFGEGGLIDSEARSATIKCDTPCTVLALSRDNFNAFSEKYPQWALPIYKKIAQMLMKRHSQTSNDLILLHKALMNEIRGS